MVHSAFESWLTDTLRMPGEWSCRRRLTEPGTLSLPPKSISSAFGCSKFHWPTFSLSPWARDRRVFTGPSLSQNRWPVRLLFFFSVKENGSKLKSEHETRISQELS